MIKPYDESTYEQNMERVSSMLWNWVKVVENERSRGYIGEYNVPHHIVSIALADWYRFYGSV